MIFERLLINFRLVLDWYLIIFWSMFWSILNHFLPRFSIDSNTWSSHYFLLKRGGGYAALLRVGYSVISRWMRSKNDFPTKHSQVSWVANTNAMLSRALQAALQAALHYYPALGQQSASEPGATIRMNLWLWTRSANQPGAIIWVHLWRQRSLRAAA